MLFKDRAAVCVVYYSEEESEEEDFKELKVLHKMRNLIIIKVVKQEKKRLFKKTWALSLPEGFWQAPTCRLNSVYELSTAEGELFKNAFSSFKPR